MYLFLNRPGMNNLAGTIELIDKASGLRGWREQL
jgi:hypothetical protein